MLMRSLYHNFKSKANIYSEHIFEKNIDNRTNVWYYTESEQTFGIEWSIHLRTEGGISYVKEISCR
jgi:hypothetical protein